MWQQEYHDQTYPFLLSTLICVYCPLRIFTSLHVWGFCLKDDVSQTFVNVKRSPCQLCRAVSILAHWLDSNLLYSYLWTSEISGRSYEQCDHSYFVFFGKLFTHIKCILTISTRVLSQYICHWVPTHFTLNLGLFHSSTESNKYYQFAHRCGVIHWSIDKLRVANLLWGNWFWLTQLPWTGWGNWSATRFHMLAYLLGPVLHLFYLFATKDPVNYCVQQPCYIEGPEFDSDCLHLLPITSFPSHSSRLFLKPRRIGDWYRITVYK